MSKNRKLYTFCYNTNASLGGFFRRWRRYLQDPSSNAPKRYGLLFNATESQFMRIAAAEAVSRLFGNVIYGWARTTMGGNRLQVGDAPTGLPAARDMNASHGKLYIKASTGKLVSMAVESLHTCCDRAEKHGLNCEPCGIVKGTADAHLTCLTYCLKRWCRRHSVPADTVLPRTHALADADDAEAISRLSRLGPVNEYEYVRPLYTCQDATFPGHSESADLRFAGEHDFSRVQDNIENLKARSVKAARSRKATRVCDAQCIFHDHCFWRNNRYRNQARACLGDDPDGDFSWSCEHKQSGGPYPQDRVEKIYKSWTSQLIESEEQARDVAFFARNGGAVTQALGPKMVLRRMGYDMRRVEFRVGRGVYGHRTRVFSVKAAHELLRTRWRVNSAGEYESPQLNMNDTPLDDTLLGVYCELCQHENFYVESRGFTSPYKPIEVIRMEYNSQVRVAGEQGGTSIHAYGELARVLAPRDFIHEFRDSGPGGVVRREPK